MLLDDPLERRRIALAIPRAFGIDDSNRTAFADAQAVRLAAQNPALLRQSELLQALLQVVPGCDATLHVAALRLGLFSAEKNMTPGDGDADGDRDFLLRVGHLRSFSEPGTCQILIRPSQSERLFSSHEYSSSSVFATVNVRSFVKGAL